MVSNKQLITLRKMIEELVEEKAPILPEIDSVLKKLEGIKAVYFDVYGTIMISGAEPMMRKDGRREVECMTDSFDAYGLDSKLKTVNRSIELLHQYVGKSHQAKKEQGIDFPEVDIIEIWEKVVEQLQEESLIGAFNKEQVPELLTNFVIRYDAPWLMPNLETTIKTLQERNIELGIISNSQFYTPITLEALSGKTMQELGFQHESSFWSFAEDIAKPSVEFYKRAEKFLSEEKGISPHDVLFVGNDMLNDVYPAHTIGFKTALFAGDTRSLRLRDDDLRCVNLTPDITITDLSQILQCIH